MNTANKITLFRILSIPIFILLFYVKPGLNAGDFYKVLAGIIFIFAAISDFFDGAYARANKEVTTFGKFMDPVADKMLIAAGFLCLMEYQEKTMVYGWMVALILGREFMVSTLRNLAISRGVVIPALPAGKWKVAAQLTAIISGLVFLATEILMKTFHTVQIAPYFFGNYSTLLLAMNLFAVVVTLYSGLVYIQENITILFPEQKAVEKKKEIASAAEPKPLKGNFAAGKTVQLQ
ncbi:CDP-diacylglycerol--glycerol-3-phosphate 3-phosphatidyltransferase [Candidatus Riflebacteria bacterium]